MPTTAQQFGLPCWTLDQIPKVIAQTAQTSAASAARFLAAHSPFQQITDCKTVGRTVSEEEVFTDIFVRSRRHVQAFVKGEPGTGKSHLIRWLKERCDYAARDDHKAFDRRRIVLVTRGNGSLKDALGQIVRELGKEFERHINRVQGAIDRLSDNTARAMLLAELALEVDTRWTNEHGRNPLPNSLKNLGQALRANGFGEWMKRDGGVIHSVIQRLTDSSTVEERETFPVFMPSDFEVPLTYLQSNSNSRDVLDFAEDLTEEDETRDLATQVLNTALQDAIRAMTGLKGDDLLTIFTEIRRQLGPDRELFVLIEDVSVMQLDLDVINAFERREGNDLCRMIAVLGIADNGWDRLPKNQKDRATHIYEVGGQTVKQWAADPEQVAKFTARYLNAVRSTEEEIQAIAEDRFTGDINRSHCEDCECRHECHAAFGKVVFENGAEVGMFPFTKHAPYSLLQNLTDAHYRSQRGLLDRILLSALDRSFDNLQSRQFPRPQMFSASLPASPFWAGFENRYCSGGAWDTNQKGRIRFLAQLWVTASNSEELASTLQPFLKPFGFPNFSSVVGEVPNCSKCGKPLCVCEIQPPPPPPPVDQELPRLLELLDTWVGGKSLAEDNKFRDLLEGLLSRSIVWEDYQAVPISEKKRLVKGNKFPRIEGQQMTPANQKYWFDFPRDQQTHKLLQGLLMFSRSRDKTWRFPDGELHKRNVSRWLRKHQALVIQSLQPNPQSIAQESLRAAVQALALTALLRDRKKLPDDRVDRVAAIFTPCWLSAARPVVFSTQFGNVVADLELKNSALREFLVSELGVGCGDANSSDFINPIPILIILSDFEKKIQFDSPPPDVASSYWAPRFSAVSDFSRSFASYQSGLEKEQQALGEVANNVRSFVEEVGFKSEDLRTDLETCLSELVSVMELQRKPSILPIANEQFDDLWKRKQLQTADVRSSWGSNVKRALDLSKGKNLSEVAAFNGAKLKECVESLRIVAHHLNLVDNEIRVQEEQVSPQGDSREQLLGKLNEIATLLHADEKG
jgi:hypothetical protein